MWCVGDLNEDYIAKMEDVLETYEQPYDPKEPVVCLDEKPVTLHADVRPATPAAPGREARRDNEYERRGTANVFCAVEPKAGRHFTYPTPNRSALEFAQVAFQLALEYPQAETIHLVMGQPQHPLPQVANRPIRCRGRRRNLGPVHCPPHTDSRKLAQSGGNRNRNLCQTMPREKENPGSEDSSPGSPRLEPSDKPSKNQNQLEVQPERSAPQIRL
jgi:hypothetical protein